MKVKNNNFFQHPCLYILLVLLFIGCKSITTSPLLITRGVIINNCEIEITNIKIVHLPTNAIASFSGILSGTTADISFSQRELLAHKAIVSWQEGNLSYQSQLKLTDHQQLTNSVSQRLVYSIYTGGVAKVQLTNDF